MADYQFDVDVLRGQIAYQIASNSEQFIWVLTNALIQVDFDDAMAVGRLGDEVADETELCHRLREIVWAIENGGLS